MPTFPRKLFTPRFSLRAMLVVVTVGCVVIGWRANRLWQNQRAIDALEKKGFIVSDGFIDYEFIDHPMLFHAGPHELSFWRETGVNKVVLDVDEGKRVDGQELPKLWGDVSELAPLNYILAQEVTFPSRTPSGYSFRTCSATYVEFLHCRFPKGAFSNAINHLPHVKTLKVFGGVWDASELLQLSKCANLESLEIHARDARAFPPGILSRIDGQRLRILTLLSIESDVCIEISEQDADAIVAMDHLERLSINSDFTFPPSHLDQLKKLKNLKYMFLALQSISDAELKAAEDELMKALPECDLDLYRIRDK